MHPEVRFYEYEDLKWPDSIRLLKLQPGHSDILSCDIVDVRTSDAPVYEALSYAWGDAVYPRLLHCGPEGTVISITENLFNALQALRSRSQGTIRTLWIDAVCINQPNLAEKGRQVAQMGDIFRNATQVVIWLGCEEAAAEVEALQQVTEISERYFSGWTQGFEVKLPILRELRKPLANGALHRFLSRSWFERVWIVQECVLAQEVQFYVGCYDLDLAQIEEALAMLGDLCESSTYAAVFSDHMSATDNHFRSVVHRTRRLFRFRYRRQYALEQGYDMQNEDQSIMDIFSLSAHRQCTDDRDRVYAMLGLFRHRLSIIPDYSKPLDKVLWDLATQSLVSGDLSLLHASGLDASEHKHAPSYVPTMEAAFGPSSSFILDVGSHARAGLRLPVEATILDLQSVRITGVAIDAIVESIDHHWVKELQSSVDKANMQWWEPTIRVYLHCVQWLKRFDAQELHDLDLNSLPNTFNDFLSSRPCQDPRPPPPYRTSAIEGQTFFDYFFHSASPHAVHVPSLASSVSDSYLDILLNDTTSRLARRRLFMTNSGYMGLGSRALREGDQVVIFDGGMTPFVLRRHAQSDDGTTRWKLVGDCYLLGWMDGEYFARQVVDESDGAAHTLVVGAGELDCARLDGVEDWDLDMMDEKILVRNSFVLC